MAFTDEHRHVVHKLLGKVAGKVRNVFATGFHIKRDHQVIGQVAKLVHKRVQKLRRG
jgi:hypothetical protein